MLPLGTYRQLRKETTIILMLALKLYSGLIILFMPKKRLAKLNIVLKMNWEINADNRERLRGMEKHEPQVLVEHIDSFGKNLSEWEVGFIANLLDNPPAEYKPKQIEIIYRIYDEKC